MVKRRQVRPRRGVLLLVILGVLTIFGMLAITLLVITGQARRSARNLQRLEQTYAPPQELLHQAFLQVVRGTNDSASVLGHHSLLEDEYGDGYYEGVVPVLVASQYPDMNAAEYLAVKPSLVAGGQLFEITLPQSANNRAHEFIGRVLTVTSGTCAGVSTRIVGIRRLPITWADLNSSLPPDPILKLRAVAEGILPKGPDLRAGRANVDDDGNGTPDDPVELATPAAIPPGSPAAARGVTDDLRPGDRFLINGKQFAGRGFGYQPETGLLDLTLDPPGSAFPRPLALLPRPFLHEWEYNTWLNAVWRPGPDGTLGTPDDRTDPPTVGANEDYDAVDYQNMLVAAIVPDGAGGFHVIPSLHRPALLNYWIFRMYAWLTGAGGMQPEAAWRAILKPQQYAPDPATYKAIVDLKRRIFLRPLLEDHPYFDGGNPGWSLFRAMDLSSLGLSELRDTIWGGVPNANIPSEVSGLSLYGPWDVDNDGDGVLDSIWVDLGLPVQAAEDGTKYKPLVAILCIDLDGRLNLNAHGNLAQLDPNYNAPPQGPYAGTTAGAPAPLPRGDGYGPAEVRLAALGIPLAQVRALLQGAGGMEGRYGERAAPSPPGPLPGLTGVDDRLSRIKQFEYSDDYTRLFVGNPANPDNWLLTSFVSPPDLWGRGTVGLDYRGQPLFWRPGPAWWLRERTDDPYEINLSRNVPRPGVLFGTPVDNPYTAAELERILRPFDVDSLQLPSRLVRLAPNLEGLRHLVTTDSWDVPGLFVSLPPEMRNQLEQRINDDAFNVVPTLSIPDPDKQRLVDWLIAFRNMARNMTHIRQLYAVKVYLTLRAEGTPGLASIPGAINSILTDSDRNTARVLPWETLMGLGMDINRPLGNGRDSNWIDSDGDGTPDAGRDGVVDEMREALGESGWADAFGSPVPFQLHNGVDVNGDGAVNAIDQLLARHLYARHLFVLAMLLVDSGYIQPTSPGTDDANLSDAQRRELTVRRIAQWAVNVVDFRDADAAMTPFEYDVNPFNGWSVDGIVYQNLNNPNDPLNDYDANGNLRNPERRVVWGCEAPELLITETFAFHDRRVVDSKHDTSQKSLDDDNDGVPREEGEDDDDPDQARIPQGAAFFELYCPRNEAAPNVQAAMVLPPDLYNYDANSGRWYLDLSRLAPPDNSGLRYPVWRMVISESRIADANNDVLQRLGRRPDSVSLEPRQFHGSTLPTENFNLLDRASGLNEPLVEIDRIVWFTDQPPVPNRHRDWNRIYWRKAGSPGLYPGEYAMVGPRPETSISALLKNPNANPPVPIGKPSGHAIRLLPVTVAGGGNSYPTSDQIKMPRPIIAAADVPQTWATDNQIADVAQLGPGVYGIGISISEPIPALGGYYPEPTERNPSTNVTDAYGDLMEQDLTKLFRDEPLDSRPGMPLADEGILGTATQVNYKTVFLQRLADPTRPYDPIANPYRTVDWSPIDLTVFNGDDRIPEGWDLADPTPDNPPVRFATRQRGGNSPLPERIIWWPISEEPPDTSPAALPTVCFRHTLTYNHPNGVYRHTLGFLNRAFHDPVWGGDQPWLTMNNSNPAYDQPVIAFPSYKGDPTSRDPATGQTKPPFPWVSWHNRPYVSPLEVLQVPTSYPARLLWEFSTRFNVNPYADLGNNVAAFGVFAPSAPLRAPFRHLANFFQDSEDYSANPGAASPAARLYRILEYLRVPSRFSGTETVGNPAAFVGMDLFRPPFNLLPTYREPGRINVNTLFSDVVWNAVLNGHSGPAFAAMVNSRRGYPPAPPNKYAGNPFLALNPVYPTRFANPFRNSASADLVPLPQLDKRRKVNASLLRAGGLNPDDPNDPAARTPLLAANDMVNQYKRTDRNAYFRYQNFAHLSNLVTTRSNVYAVWLTVGYFQVEKLPPGSYDPNVYPDGYRLGPELGSETGQITRHRAFYIFDRSVPVGFKRGEDLNVEKAILVKRFVE